jgi:hypothetical protein
MITVSAAVQVATTWYNPSRAVAGQAVVHSPGFCRTLLLLTWHIPKVQVPALKGKAYNR